MVWLDPRDESKGIAPLHYRLENNTYKIKIEQTTDERKSDLYSWMEFLGNMWGDWRGWWVSGATAISFITDTYPRTHTNTDIALLREPDLLSYMVERAEQNRLYLFRRLRSYKPTPNPKDPRKYEEYYPMSVDKVIKDKGSNRNYQFCLVDGNGNVVTQNRLYDRIKLYFHYLDKKDRLLSSEDGLFIEPFWLSNSSPYRTRSGKTVYTASLDYLKFIKRDVLRNWRWKWNPKHREDMERMIQFISREKSERFFQLPILI